MGFTPALAVLVLILYFLPWAIAIDRRHRNSTAIAVLNLLLGWTAIGWIVALVWACTANVLPPSEEKAPDRLARKLAVGAVGIIALWALISVASSLRTLSEPGKTIQPAVYSSAPATTARQPARLPAKRREPAKVQQQPPVPEAGVANAADCAPGGAIWNASTRKYVCGPPRESASGLSQTACPNEETELQHYAFTRTQKLYNAGCSFSASRPECASAIAEARADLRAEAERLGAGRCDLKWAIAGYLATN